MLGASPGRWGRHWHSCAVPLCAERHAGTWHGALCVRCIRDTMQLSMSHWCMCIPYTAGSSARRRARVAWRAVSLSGGVCCRELENEASRVASLPPGVARSAVSMHE